VAPRKNIPKPKFLMSGGKRETNEVFMCAILAKDFECSTTLSNFTQHMNFVFASKEKYGYLSADLFKDLFALA
jgi:hypothetical protein